MSGSVTTYGVLRKKQHIPTRISTRTAAPPFAEPTWAVAVALTILITL